MENALKLDIKGIKCDNCDFKDTSVRFEDYNEWLNKPCPKCGANLLTWEDFISTKALILAVDIINKIFPKVEDYAEEKVVAIEMNGTGKIEFKEIEGRE